MKSNLKLIKTETPLVEYHSDNFIIKIEDGDRIKTVSGKVMIFEKPSRIKLKELPEPPKAA